MSQQPIAAVNIPIRDDLEMAQDDIQMAQQELHGILEQIIEALDAGKAVEPKFFQEAEEQIKELEVQAGSLRTDLEKLKAQQPPN